MKLRMFYGSSLSQVAIYFMILILGLVPFQGAVAGASHGLIIAIGKYKSPDVQPLPGTEQDVSSAKQIATGLGFDPSAFVVLQDKDATRERIMEELGRLSTRVTYDSDVFVYFSGHGARFFDPNLPNCSGESCCREVYLPYDSATYIDSMLQVGDFGVSLNQIAKRAKRVFFMVDSCHSAGLTSSSRRSSSRPAKGNYVPKTTSFFDADARCKATVNFKSGVTTRGSRSGLPDYFEKNVVQVSAAAANEVAWTNSETGGLATSSLLSCVNGEAKDLDQSGSISLSELQVCTQKSLLKHKIPPPGLPSTVSFKSSQRIIFPSLNSDVEHNSSVVSILANQEERKTLEEQRRVVIARLDEEKSAREQSERIERQRQEALRVAEEKRQKEQTERLERERQEALKIAEDKRKQEQIERIERQRQEALRVAEERLQKEQTERLEGERQEALREAEERERRIALLMERLADANEELEQLANAYPTAPFLQYEEAKATMTDLYESRDPRILVDVTGLKKSQKIGEDYYRFEVLTNNDGYLYVLHLGSDQTEFTLLFPNALEGFNNVTRNLRFPLPGPGWTIETSGPEGDTYLLVLVSKEQIDINQINNAFRASFKNIPADIPGRRQLVKVFLGSRGGGLFESNRYGARFFAVREVK